jgi:hypothetical protein
MFSLIKGIWTVFKHAFRRRETVLYPEEKPYLARGIGDASSCPETRTVVNGVSRVISARRYVPLTVFLSKLRRLKTDAGTPSFSALISRDAFSVGFVKKRVRHTLFS